MIERLLQAEATRRLKVEASEVHGRLALSNSFACRVEVALSRVARNERGKEVTRRRTRSSSVLGSTNASVMSLTARREAQRHQVPYVERQRQAQRRHVLEESDELRQLRLQNLQNAALREKEAKLVDESVLHAKVSAESRHNAVQVFATSLKRQLATRLHAMVNATGDTGFFSPQAQRKLLPPLRHSVGDTSVRHGRTPSPARNHRSDVGAAADAPSVVRGKHHSSGRHGDAAAAAATLGGRIDRGAVHAAESNATTPPLLDAEAIADATCRWIAHIAQDEEEARRLADQALVDIRREVNLEACRQRKLTEAKKQSQSEQVVQRNEMTRTVELAQQRATSSVRALAAKARTASRVSEAQLRTARLPVCMRHAASVFSLQELETVMSKHLQSSMEAHQLRRRTDLTNTVAYFSEALAAAEESGSRTKTDAADVLSDVCLSINRRRDQSSATKALPPCSVVNTLAPHRFLFGGSATSSPLRTFSKHNAAIHCNAQRQLLKSSLNQLLARCVSDDGTPSAGGNKRPAHRPSLADEVTAAKDVAPSLPQPSSALVEALISHLCELKGGDGSCRSSPKNGNLVLVGSPTPLAKSIGNGFRKPNDVLDLSSCRRLAVADLALVKECLGLIDPRVTTLRIADSAVSEDATVAAALLELCLGHPHITSVEMQEADAVPLDATSVDGQRTTSSMRDERSQSPAVAASPEQIHAITQAVVRKQREVSLHRRGLHMAKQKLSHVRALESEESMRLGPLRRRLVHSVRMLVDCFEFGERLGRGHIAFVQDAESAALHDQEQRALRCVQARLVKHDIDARAQRVVIDEEAAERLAMEHLVERHGLLLTKELLTAKQTFRRLSRRLSMGLALSKRSSVVEGGGGGNDGQPIHSKPQSPVFPSQKTSRAVSPVEDDDEATPDADRRERVASIAAAAEGHFGPIALSMRISPRSSRDPSRCDVAPETDAAPSTATTGDPSSSFVDVPHQLETKASEIAQDDIRPIHSSSATRPKQVVFQSPPPSRQRVE